MAEIRDYSTSPDPQTTDRWPEGMAMSAVNDTGRVDEGILARWYRDTRGDIVSTGSANAYVITANRSFSGGYDGLEMAFQANFTNTGAATLEVSGGVTATSIVDRFGQPLTGREIQSGAKIRVVYGSSSWILLSASQRARQEINVKDYGAVGDGVADDTQAFTDAEADRSSLGWKKTHVPEGTYLVTTAPDWNRITGAGNVLYNGDTIPAGDIDDFVTLNVPGTFATIDDAWAYLRTRTIKYSQEKAARVTVRVADGTYSIASQVNLNHPQGATIALRGNETTPANCVLQFTHGGAGALGNGLSVTFGHTLGFLNGFKIELPTKAESPNAGSGLLADASSYINCGPNMEVNNFYYGVQARYGAVIRCRGIKVDNAGDVGIFAYLGGIIEASNAQSNNADDATNNLGSGFAPEWGGIMNAENATATGNRLGGLEQLNDGVLRTRGTATGETDRLVTSRGNINADGDDSVIDINLFPKGAGSYVRIGAGFFSTGDNPMSGYIEIKDATGTPRRLMVWTP